MALVRCSCIVELLGSSDCRSALEVRILDPECGYVVHRLGAELLTATEPDTLAS